MYDVPLTPAEIWIGIAIFAIVIIVGAIWKSITGLRPMTDEEYRAACEKDYREFKESLAKHQKEHPEIWDENGNLHGSPKTKD